MSIGDEIAPGAAPVTVLLPPRCLTIETTSSCQLRCPACPTPVGLGRPRGFFTAKLMDHLLAQVDWQLDCISFGWSGEPLLNRELPALILAASQVARTYVSTNGLLLERDADLLLSAGLDHLRVCLDGVDQTMAEIYRVGTDFEKVVAGAKHLARRRKERGLVKPKISLQMLVTKHTEAFLEQFIQLAMGCGVDEVYFKSFNLSLSDWLLPEQRAQMAEEFLPDNPRFLRYERHLSGSWGLRPELRATLCPEVESGMTILHTGEVVPCCEDFRGSYILGNVRQESLLEIWRGERYRQLRSQVHRREPAMCRDCAYPGSDGYNQVIQINGTPQIARSVA